MNKYLSVFLVFGFLFGFTNATFAENTGGYNASGSNTRAGAPILMNNKTPAEVEAMRLEAKQKMEALKTQAQNLKDKTKAQALEKRVLARENLLAKFDKAINTVTESKNRIENQLPKIESLGVDTTKAKANLAEAEAKLNSAKTKIAEANSLLAGVSGELSAENKAKLKTLASETQTLIREAHKTLGDTLKMLREAVRAKKNNNNSNVGSSGQGNTTINEPTYACSYAPAPTGCSYVPGPEYNSQNSCGMVLSCPDQQ